MGKLALGADRTERRPSRPPEAGVDMLTDVFRADPGEEMIEHDGSGSDVTAGRDVG